MPAIFRSCVVSASMSAYAEIDEVALPFLTLDAEHIDHSGTVLIVCPDPRMVAGANPPAPSRVQQLVASVRNQPGQPYGLSAHVIAVTCPPRILGENPQQRQFVLQNIPVLAGVPGRGSRRRTSSFSGNF